MNVEKSLAVELAQNFIEPIYNLGYAQSFPCENCVLSKEVGTVKQCTSKRDGINSRRATLLGICTNHTPVQYFPEEGGLFPQLSEEVNS